MRQLKIVPNNFTNRCEDLARYLVEIDRQPLLTIDEEIELAQKRKQGGREGELAVDKLVKCNLRFVVPVAKQYLHQGLSLTDLINEGNIGLVKAAWKFDETRGFKFISYAIWWIRQSILQAIGGNVSIDDRIDSGDDTRAGKGADYESMVQELNEELSQVLNEREIKIMRYCFGIGCHEKGLEEIGDELGLTRERVRQIRERCITKLRNSGHAKILMKYLG